MRGSRSNEDANRGFQKKMDRSQGGRGMQQGAFYRLNIFLEIPMQTPLEYSLGRENFHSLRSGSLSYHHLRS